MDTAAKELCCVLLYLARGKREEVGHGGEASGHASGVVNWENTYLVT